MARPLRITPRRDARRGLSAAARADTRCENQLGATLTTPLRNPLKALIALASLLVPFAAQANDPVPVAWSFDDSDGDGIMWLCKAPRSDDDTEGVLRVDTSGYFKLSTIDDTMFDSGDEQLNESYYLLVKNSRNPEGFPIDPNCGDVSVLFDSAVLPAHLGTFYVPSWCPPATGSRSAAAARARPSPTPPASRAKPRCC